MTRSRPPWLWVVPVLAVLGILFYLTREFVSLEEIKRLSRELVHFKEQNMTVLFGVLAATQALGMIFSLPTKAVLNLLAGALLGTVWGSVATTLGVLSGTTILFFAVRHLFRDRFAKKMEGSVRNLEQKISRRPVRAMIGLRLFITLPFGPITVAAGLSSMGYRDFIVGTAIGDIPVVVLYSLAAQRLMSITSVSDALSPSTVAILIGAALIFIVATFVGKSKKQAG